MKHKNKKLKKQERESRKGVLKGEWKIEEEKGEKENWGGERTREEEEAEREPLKEMSWQTNAMGFRHQRPSESYTLGAANT